MVVGMDEAANSLLGTPGSPNLRWVVTFLALSARKRPG